MACEYRALLERLLAGAIERILLNEYRLPSDGKHVRPSRLRHRRNRDFKKVNALLIALRDMEG